MKTPLKFKELIKDDKLIELLDKIITEIGENNRLLNNRYDLVFEISVTGNIQDIIVYSLSEEVEFYYHGSSVDNIYLKLETILMSLNGDNKEQSLKYKKMEIKNKFSRKVDELTLEELDEVLNIFKEK